VWQQCGTTPVIRIDLKGEVGCRRKAEGGRKSRQKTTTFTSLWWSKKVTRQKFGDDTRHTVCAVALAKVYDSRKNIRTIEPEP
jgi:hypothetical protein